MSAQFPDEGTIQTALSLAGRAPSMQNSQPWRWQVRPHLLHLYADGGRGLPNTDLGRRDLLLSCGAAPNHCVVGLAALGWQAKIHRFPDTRAPDHLAAIELHPFPAAETDVTLAAAIPRRRTDRRRYAPWPVQRGDLALMGARAARCGVTMRRVEALNGLASRMTSASQQAVDVERMPQHTTGSGRYASNLEAQVRTIPESGPAALLLAPLPPASALLPTAEDRSDGVVLALGTTYDDVMAHLRAGEATSVVLLTATALGLASCPASEPLAAIAARKLFRENVFNAEGLPQMLLRIGWAPVNADPLPSTPRRELTDVVEWLGDDGGAS